MNLEAGGCSEPRLRHCTPAWVTEQDSITTKKEKKKVITIETEAYQRGTGAVGQGLKSSLLGTLLTFW